MAWNKEGQSQENSDIPLDEEGIQMAEHVATRLASEQWDLIYLSPLLRAIKTAKIIAIETHNRISPRQTPDNEWIS